MTIDSKDSKSKWGKKVEDGNDSVSQLTGLESARQSIPAVRFRLAAPASTSPSISGSAKLSTVL